MHKDMIIRALAFLSVLCMSSAAYAVITEVQPLSFGTFAMRNNDAAYNYLVLPNGTTSINPNYLPFVDGQRGEFDLTSFPPNTNLMIGITFTDLESGHGGEDFTVSTPQILPGTTTTDGAGSLTIFVGATMTSSGTSTTYFNGTFNSTMTIMVNW